MRSPDMTPSDSMLLSLSRSGGLGDLRRLLLTCVCSASPGLDDELRDVVHLDSDGALQAAAGQDLGAAPGGGVDPGTEGGA